jgi:hypothetical protein
MTNRLAVTSRLPGEPQLLQDALARTAAHRLMVISPTPAEAVRHVGGWLFDHAAAGWVATVLTTGQADPRPLHILGARAHDLQDSLEQGPYSRCLQAIAVHAGLYQSQARIRDLVDQACGYELDEILLWGGVPPGGPAKRHGHAGNPQPHYLSAAARAFKAHALAALRIPPSALGSPAPADASGDTELLRTIAVSRPAPEAEPEAHAATQRRTGRGSADPGLIGPVRTVQRKRELATRARTYGFGPQ